MSGCLDNFPLVAPFGLIKTIPSLLNIRWSLQKAVKHHCSALWPRTTSTGVLLLWKTHVALPLLIHQECEQHMYVCLRGEHKLQRSQVCSHHLLKLKSCFWGQPRCRATGTWDKGGVKPWGSGSHGECSRTDLEHCAAEGLNALMTKRVHRSRKKINELCCLQTVRLKLSLCRSPPPSPHGQDAHSPHYSVQGRNCWLFQI